MNGFGRQQRCSARLSPTERGHFQLTGHSATPFTCSPFSIVSHITSVFVWAFPSRSAPLTYPIDQRRLTSCYPLISQRYFKYVSLPGSSSTSSSRGRYSAAVQEWSSRSQWLPCRVTVPKSRNERVKYCLTLLYWLCLINVCLLFIQTYIKE